MTKLQDLVSLCKRRGIIFQNSDIYGGIAGFFDYGPTGAQMKINLKKLWWDDMVKNRRNVVGIDGSIITHPKVWEASGHVKGFADLLAECRSCHKRFRVDQLVKEKKDRCPECQGKLGKPKKFNILFHTEVGVIEGEKTKTYLRGEACQTIYLNYQNVLDSTRLQVPFGIAQIGKAFRNEVTPKNFLYRSREFEQWDLQFFVHPKDMVKYYEFWKQERFNWYQSLLNHKKDIRFRQHAQDELVFYAKKAFDIEYKTDFAGWVEWEGIHWRADYDLTQHSKFSGKKLDYKDPKTGEAYLPWIVETSGGVDRTFMFLLLDAYTTETVNGKERTVLKIDPRLATYQVAVIPLAANQPKLIKYADQIFKDLSQKFSVDWDDSSNIGKKYRRQDEIGTPFCLTVDFDSLSDHTVTLRDRDSMKQERIPVKKIESFLSKKLKL
jgi:glycyl-tRNA synthetase